MHQPSTNQSKYNEKNEDIIMKSMGHQLSQFNLSNTVNHNIMLNTKSDFYAKELIELEQKLVENGTVFIFYSYNEDTEQNNNFSSHMNMIHKKWDDKKINYKHLTDKDIKNQAQFVQKFTKQQLSSTMKRIRFIESDYFCKSMKTFRGNQNNNKKKTESHMQYAIIISNALTEDLMDWLTIIDDESEGIKCIQYVTAKINISNEKTELLEILFKTGKHKFNMKPIPPKINIRKIGVSLNENEKLIYDEAYENAKFALYKLSQSIGNTQNIENGNMEHELEEQKDDNSNKMNIEINLIKQQLNLNAKFKIVESLSDFVIAQSKIQMLHFMLMDVVKNAIKSIHKRIIIISKYIEYICSNIDTGCYGKLLSNSNTNIIKCGSKDLKNRFISKQIQQRFCNPYTPEDQLECISCKKIPREQDDDDTCKYCAKLRLNSKGHANVDILFISAVALKKILYLISIKLHPHFNGVSQLYFVEPIPIHSNSQYKCINYENIMQKTAENGKIMDVTIFFHNDTIEEKYVININQTINSNEFIEKIFNFKSIKSWMRKCKVLDFKQTIQFYTKSNVNKDISNSKEPEIKYLTVNEQGKFMKNETYQQFQKDLNEFIKNDLNSKYIKLERSKVNKSKNNSWQKDLVSMFYRESGWRIKDVNDGKTIDKFKKIFNNRLTNTKKPTKNK